jgi:16S rRNA (cytosine967-C5)-methyltransferase
LLSTALALAWDEAQAPYPPFTLVNQAVEAAKNGAARAQSGFINACLRRFLRERDALVSATDNDPVAVWNHPAWWIARLKKDHPQDWQAILAANNAQPPMTLRVNAQKSTPAQYQNALQAMNLKATAVAECGLQLEQAVPVQELPHLKRAGPRCRTVRRRPLPRCCWPACPAPGAPAARAGCLCCARRQDRPSA